MAGIFFEIDEVLNESIMTGVPSVIVEGIDDISIYVDISKRVPFDVEVYAVEHIEGFSAGCDKVIDAINALEDLPQTQHRLESHVLGIVDKDVRDFRGDMPSSTSVLVLKYYSIESHFASREVIGNTLRLCTKSSAGMVSDELCDLIMEEIEQKILDLYYHSLEALRNSLEKDYVADFAYSYLPGRVKDVNAKALIAAKRDELDLFANRLGLNRSISVVKSIARGKWLIDVFSEELVRCINGLQGLCREQKINSCLSCVTHAFDKCLYRMREGVHANTVKSLAFSHSVGREFDYIVDRISQIRA